MSARQCHQPIGFVCCHCRYRSSGSYCSNPDRLDCPHRQHPRCQSCPILFTPSRSGYGWSNGRSSETAGTQQNQIQTKERQHSIASSTSDGNPCEESRTPRGQV
ncbi:hypothetical protein F4677DRAFT_410002 [Hypoxylon crocopeplum]|nr:hypothetical protein F4677DRAFT_410002 [Hypoxylon crocopeplum]